MQQQGKKVVYERPSMDVVLRLEEDVITASGGGEQGIQWSWSGISDSWSDWK